MKTRQVGRGLARYLLAGALSALLVGCGGGGGDDDDPIDIGGDVGGGLASDIDSDGIPDDEDDDLDGDGILNAEDDDVDNDGFANFEDDDIDGDGIDNDIDDSPSGFGVAAGGLTCPGSGDDPASQDDEWDNNCVLTLGRTSYYTRGVQRILFCLGFDEGATEIGQFADAQYGDVTADAVRAFQQDRGLVDDGIVGPQTWTALRNSLEFIEDNPTQMDESYAVADALDRPGCGNLVQFYREYDVDSDDPTAETFTGWKIANNPGETQRVEFSIRNPFE